MSTEAAEVPAENPYGLRAALEEGGIVAQATFGILVLMSAASWYILFTKWFEQQKILKQGKRARENFWRANSLREGAAKLEKNSAYRQIVEDGIQAREHHDQLTDPVEAHEWTVNALQRSVGSINSKLTEGLAILATVGSTAPFIGLFGTVVGIYRALVKIGAAGQASIDTVAGPVGEALIMTALGLIVAVPAVMAYNWMVRRNKAVSEELQKFSNQIHGYIVSDGKVKPAAPAAAAGKAPAAKATTTAAKPATKS
ncbi:MotA/TolQ/ExbB proton channel family protein [Parasphingopyxis algicola]|uniref:MotA/TolQ/ExbB proton channel family protein n=1 Tax=Parasphingopyxis algicola TaxID=2026624 RepID=UPI00159FB945|nr:MotA/TolQ/ExbB proton channel family protein [Parasphingopyxis algicola]QLC26685.1 MotA/TolQ/ExbB proton channel family protein [Parasphingopyxis algicola]